MSNRIPIFQYPGGNLVRSLTKNTIYKWIDAYGGGKLEAPLEKGTPLPHRSGTAHGGILTRKGGVATVEYHFTGI